MDVMTHLIALVNAPLRTIERFLSINDLRRAAYTAEKLMDSDYEKEVVRNVDKCICFLHKGTIEIDCVIISIRHEFLLEMDKNNLLSFG